LYGLIEQRALFAQLIGKVDQQRSRDAERNHTGNDRGRTETPELQHQHGENAEYRHQYRRRQAAEPLLLCLHIPGHRDAKARR